MDRVFRYEIVNEEVFGIESREIPWKIYINHKVIFYFVTSGRPYFCTTEQKEYYFITYTIFKHKGVNL